MKRLAAAAITAAIALTGTIAAVVPAHAAQDLPGSVGSTSSAVALRPLVAPKGKVSAVTLLDGLRVRAESRTGSYERSRFTLWVDADHDGENTRAEVLRSESTKQPRSNARHTVVTGRWVSPYDGSVVTKASKLDIDHVVPLEEAWTSGAASWSATRREAYANDLGYGPALVAVTLHENRSKGDREPDEWMPVKASYACTYLRSWVAIKSRWKLAVDPAEKAFLTTRLDACANRYVTRPGVPTVAKLVSTTGKKAPKPTGGAGSGGGTTSGVDSRYSTCTELLRHPNHAPYRRGVDPEYAWYQDRDHDGRVCE